MKKLLLFFLMTVPLVGQTFVLNPTRIVDNKTYRSIPMKVERAVSYTFVISVLGQGNFSLRGRTVFNRDTSGYIIFDSIATTPGLTKYTYSLTGDSIQNVWLPDDAGSQGSAGEQYKTMAGWGLVFEIVTSSSNNATVSIIKSASLPVVILPQILNDTAAYVLHADSNRVQKGYVTMSYFLANSGSGGGSWPDSITVNSTKYPSMTLAATAPVRLSSSSGTFTYALGGDDSVRLSPTQRDISQGAKDSTTIGGTKSNAFTLQTPLRVSGSQISWGGDDSLRVTAVQKARMDSSIAAGDLITITNQGTIKKIGSDTSGFFGRYGGVTSESDPLAVKKADSASYSLGYVTKKSQTDTLNAGVVRAESDPLAVKKADSSSYSIGYVTKKSQTDTLNANVVRSESDPLAVKKADSSSYSLGYVTKKSQTDTLNANVVRTESDPVYAAAAAGLRLKSDTTKPNGTVTWTQARIEVKDTLDKAFTDTTGRNLAVQNISAGGGTNAQVLTNIGGAHVAWRDAGGSADTNRYMPIANSPKFTTGRISIGTLKSLSNVNVAGLNADTVTTTNLTAIVGSVDSALIGKHRSDTLKSIRFQSDSILFRSVYERPPIAPVRNSTSPNYTHLAGYEVIDTYIDLIVGDPTQEHYAFYIVTDSANGVELLYITYESIADQQGSSSSWRNAIIGPHPTDGWGSTGWHTGGASFTSYTYYADALLRCKVKYMGTRKRLGLLFTGNEAGKGGNNVYLKLTVHYRLPQGSISAMPFRIINYVW